MISVFFAAALQVATPQSPFGVSIRPDNPRQGTAITVVVGPVESATLQLVDVRGRLAGEMLHFDRVGSEYHSTAGLPVLREGVLEFPLVLHFEDGSTEVMTGSVSISSGDYGADTLRVNSSFSTPLTAEQRDRISGERARSAALTEISHETPRLWSQPFQLPLNSRTTSSYGRTRVFNGEIRSRHMGVDLDGETGDEVSVANDGVVALVGDFFYSGNIIYVNHGAGVITAYSHLSRTAVAEGDRVLRGQVIGFVGQTGRVTGPHLHWAARYGSISIDARTLLELPSTISGQ